MISGKPYSSIDLNTISTSARFVNDYNWYIENVIKEAIGDESYEQFIIEPTKENDELIKYIIENLVNIDNVEGFETIFAMYVAFILLNSVLKETDENETKLGKLKSLNSLSKKDLEYLIGLSNENLNDLGITNKRVSEIKEFYNIIKFIEENKKFLMPEVGIKIGQMVDHLRNINKDSDIIRKYDDAATRIDNIEKTAKKGAYNEYIEKESSLSNNQLSALEDDLNSIIIDGTDKQSVLDVLDNADISSITIQDGYLAVSDNKVVEVDKLLSSSDSNIGKMGLKTHFDINKLKESLNLKDVDDTVVLLEVIKTIKTQRDVKFINDFSSKTGLYITFGVKARNEKRIDTENPMNPAIKHTFYDYQDLELLYLNPGFVKQFF